MGRNGFTLGRGVRCSNCLARFFFFFVTRGNKATARGTPPPPPPARIAFSAIVVFRYFQFLFHQAGTSFINHRQRRLRIIAIETTRASFSCSIQIFSAHIMVHIIFRSKSKWSLLCVAAVVAVHRV